jgi:hypothetical protein
VIIITFSFLETGNPASGRVSGSDMSRHLALGCDADAVRSIFENGGMSESRDGRTHRQGERNDCDELLHGTSPNLDSVYAARLDTSAAPRPNRPHRRSDHRAIAEESVA